MRKIEEQMLNALALGKEMEKDNTQVIVRNGDKFVKLYGTIIFANVNGKEYFSDGGYKTATTASRLRALGADYSSSRKVQNKGLTRQQDMINMMWESSHPSK